MGIREGGGEGGKERLRFGKVMVLNYLCLMANIIYILEEISGF